LEDQIELLAPEQESRRGGVSAAILASFVVHLLLILYLVNTYRGVARDTPAPPIVRYVELMRQQPRDFTEAPGPKVKAAPLTAPFSDANREASTPKPTGTTPTLRPGDGSFFTPQQPPPGEQAARQAQLAAEEIRAPQPQQQAAATQPTPSTPSNPATLQDSSTFRYRPTQANAAATINWRSAVREVKVADLGGGQHQGPDFGNAAGGEKGFAKDGPLSFESQWYDWGEYAESMVSRIRVNWYNNMPQLIQTGLKGVVTIRFAIHRDGHLTDITILESSGHPPYDFAAKKAIELSSPLNPLPKDFPNDIEHVTAMFFYNQEPPERNGRG
jgi:TonB family protein